MIRRASAGFPLARAAALRQDSTFSGESTAATASRIGAVRGRRFGRNPLTRRRSRVYRAYADVPPRPPASRNTSTCTLTCRYCPSALAGIPAASLRRTGRLATITTGLTRGHALAGLLKA